MAEWKKDLHPRDRLGRWADKGSSSAGGWAVDAADREKMAKFSLRKNYVDVGDGVGKPSLDEIDAIKTYTIGMPLNDKLRSGKRIDREDKYVIKNLDAVFSRSSLDKDTVVYRAYSDKASGLMRDLEPGSRLLDKGYVSTALSPEAAQYASMLNYGMMEILVPAGSQAINVTKVLPSFEKQKEVLFPRGTALEYVGDDPEDGTKVFRLVSDKTPKEIRRKTKS